MVLFHKPFLRSCLGLYASLIGVGAALNLSEHT